MISALSAANSFVRPVIRFGEKPPEKKVVTPEQEVMDKQYAAKGHAAKFGQYFLSTLVMYAGSAFSLGIMMPHFLKPDFYTMRGDVRMARKKYAEAEADYLKALALEEKRSIKDAPSIRYTLKRLAEATKAQDKTDESEQYRARAQAYDGWI